MTVDPTSYPHQGSLHRERMQFERDFTQLRNQWLRDKRISRGARGLLAELMTHEVGYEVTIVGLVAGGPEGRDAIRSMVGELERCGYLHRSARRRKGRFGGDVWHLQDPFAEPTPAPPTLPIEGFEPVDNSPAHRVGLSGAGQTGAGPTASVNPTTIEDQVKNNIRLLPSATQERPVDNFRGRCGHPLVDDRHCGMGCPVEAVV